jgi:hypothetical protein
VLRRKALRHTLGVEGVILIMAAESHWRLPKYDLRYMSVAAFSTRGFYKE